MIRTWEEIVQEIQTNHFPNPFSAFTDELQAIGVEKSDALTYSKIQYKALFTDLCLDEINYICMMIHQANIKKYEKLIALYTREYDPIANVDATETYEEIRTPDLTRSTEGEGSSSSSVHNHQTRTTTETPTDYSSTSIHSVDPYDGSGFHTESKTQTTDSGSRTTSESYSGDPDEAEATTESTSTTTETGTETTEHTLRRKGNIGVTSTQQLINQEIQLLPSFNVLKVILEDVAAQIFYQVW